MTFPTLVIIVAASASLPLPIRAQGSPDKSLSSYRDSNRVLLVFAASERDASYRQQLGLWQNEKAGFEDRQLVVLPMLKAGKPSTSDAPGTLAKRFGADGASFEVILIGKDGHDAYRSNTPVTAEVLYRRIDAMPMRREELKHQKPKQAQP